MDSKHPEVKFGKTGVLIINLGTPDSTSWWDIRKYLKEFLSDRRVIEVNPIIWQFILNLFILNFRPSKTAKAYKEIWMRDKDMSPLRYYTESQAQKLSKQIGILNCPEYGGLMPLALACTNVSRGRTIAICAISFYSTVHLTVDCEVSSIRMKS